jgi:hypothetical protein
MYTKTIVTSTQHSTRHYQRGSWHAITPLYAYIFIFNKNKIFIVYLIHILCLLTDDNDNPIIIRPHIVFTYIMIGLLFSSVSKHNMWSYHDWVVVLVVRQ